LHLRFIFFVRSVAVQKHVQAFQQKTLVYYN
jgi:hypothetical protein